MTTFLMCVLVNDGFAGAKQILWLCYDPSTGQTLAVYPQGYFCFFAETTPSAEAALEKLECYLAGRHKVDPETAMRLEGLRTFMASRGWNNGVKLLNMLCTESQRDQAFGDELFHWVENGSTLRLFALVRKIEVAAKKMFDGCKDPYPLDNAMFGLDTAFGYMSK